MYTYYLRPFIDVFKFKGRASLKEFWYFFLVNFLISLALIFTKNIHGQDNLGVYYRYITLIPIISLGFRRLHDTGQNGFLFLVPAAGLLLAGLPGDKEANKYGNSTMSEA